MVQVWRSRAPTCLTSRHLAARHRELVELWFNESDKNASFETKLTYECVIFATVVGKDLSLTKRPTYMHAKDYTSGALELRVCLASLNGLGR